MPTWPRTHQQISRHTPCAVRGAAGQAFDLPGNKHTLCAPLWQSVGRSDVLSTSCRRYASGARCTIECTLFGLTMARRTPSGFAATGDRVGARFSLAPCHISGAARSRAGSFARLPDVVLGSGTLVRSNRPTTTAHESLGIHEKRNADQCLAARGVPDRNR
jgi:hypothetical protein